MGKITDQEWRALFEMDTRPILDAVDAIDQLRDDLSDQEGYKPPQIRHDLLKLHRLGMEVRTQRGDRVTVEFFELLDELDSQVSGMMGALSKIQDVLEAFQPLFPESLSEFLEPFAEEEEDDEERSEEEDPDA